MSARSRRGSGLGAVDLLEEAIRLLRGAPASALALYAAGALPFVLGLLFFTTDMARSALAEAHLAGASLGVAALFVWMKAGQAAFCDRLRATLTAEAPRPWSAARAARTAAVQAALQPTGFVVLPLAALATLPLGWAWAFYQSLSVVGDGEGIRDAARRSWAQASLWPRQNHLLLLLASLVGLVVLLNLTLTLALLPTLARSLLGLDTAFTREGWNGFELTFVSMVLSLAYVCVDPLLKAAYVLRCFYGESVRSGADLEARLRRLPPRAAVLAAVAFLLLSPQGGRATPSPVPAPAASVSSAELGRSIERVLARPAFTWRAQRVPVPNRPKGLLARFLRDSVETLGRWAEAAARWWDRAADWVRGLLGIKRRDLPEEEPSRVRPGLLRWPLVAGAAFAAGLLAWLLLRRRRRLAAVETAADATPPGVDLVLEEARPEERPTDGWLALGRELAARGDLRLALRAFFLATLAGLAEAGVISLDRHKSNRDYVAEVRRRSHAFPHVPPAFEENVRLLERVWYGTHEATPEALGRFTANQERILGPGGR